MRTKLSTIGSSISFPSRSCFFRSFFFICWHSQGASLLVGVELLGGRAMAAAKGERFPVPSVTSHFRPTVLVSFRSSPIPCRHSYRESLDRNHRTLREYYQLNAFCPHPCTHWNLSGAWWMDKEQDKKRLYWKSTMIHLCFVEIITLYWYSLMSFYVG